MQPAPESGRAGGREDVRQTRSGDPAVDAAFAQARADRRYGRVHSQPADYAGEGFSRDARRSGRGHADPARGGRDVSARGGADGARAARAVGHWTSAHAPASIAERDGPPAPAEGEL